MKRITMSVAVLAMLVMAAPSTINAADDAKPKKKAAAKGDKAKGKKGQQVKGYWGIVASFIKLTDEQKPKYMEIVKAQGAANKGLQEKAKAAKGDKDAQKKLREERAKISADTKAKITALLTDEQEDALAGYNLYTQMMRAVSKADVSDDQKAKIKDASLAAGKSYRAAGKDKKVAAAARNDLRSNVVKDILTADQRTKVQDAAKAKASKPKPKKGDAKPKKPKA
jgi:hypothetical protein